MHCIVGTMIRSLFVKTIWVLIRKLHSIGTGQYIRKATFDGKGKRSKNRRDKCNKSNASLGSYRSTIKRKGYSYTLGRREQRQREECEVSFSFGCKEDQTFQWNTGFLDGFLCINASNYSGADFTYTCSYKDDSKFEREVNW